MRTLRVPDWRHGGQGHRDIMNDVFLPQGRYPENFMLISLLDVWQEGWVKKGGTSRTLGVPDRRHGGQGHS